jgi:hypothetical protein
VGKCAVLRAATSPTGTATCSEGSAHGEIGLLADIYLTGDLLDGTAPDRPDVPGFQPCPRCDPLSGRCQGGPRHGQSCAPAAGDATHDCPPPPSAFVASVPISLALTTGIVARTSHDLAAQEFVFCGFCAQRFAPSFEGHCSGGTRDGSPCATQAGCPDGACEPTPCTDDAQCTRPPFTTCRQRTPGAFGHGPVRTMAAAGSPAGHLGDGAWHHASLVGLFCVPPTFNPNVDSVGDLPGPGVISLPGRVRLRRARQAQ